MVSITSSCRRRERNRRKNWENSPAADPLRLRITLTLFSLSRCWAETAITWRLIVRMPQLRNAQLPDRAVTFCACANSYISCAWTFVGAFAYFRVYSCYFKGLLTFYPWRWTFGTLSAREIIENKLRVYVLLWESARGVRARKCVHVFNRIETGWLEKTLAFGTGV